MFHCPCICIKLWCVLIELLLYARMNDQLLQRIFIIDRKDCLKLLRIFHSDSCFDWDFQITFPKNRIQKSIQLLWLIQKSRSSSLRHNSSRRTSQIKVHFLIPKLSHHLCHFYKIFWLIRKNLRHCIHSLIMLRHHILLLSCAEMSFLIRTDKRNKILIESVKALM